MMPPALRFEALRELADAIDLLATARAKILRAQALCSHGGNARSDLMRRADSVYREAEGLRAVWLQDAAAAGLEERLASAVAPTRPAPPLASDDDDADPLGCR